MKPSIKHYTFLSVLLITLTISFSSCKDSSPTEPVELKPGRRDYQWTVDTMMPTPFDMVTRMWGDSEDNIWAVGIAGDYDKAIWHYDGIKWSLVPNPQHVSPVGLFGFDKNNIWVSGIWGKFWKYNGVSWTMTDELKITGYSRIGIENIWGESPDNIYASGTAYCDVTGSRSIAVLCHYNGKSWSVIKTPGIYGDFYNIEKDTKGSGLYFLKLYQWETVIQDSNKIFSFDGTNLKEIYKGLCNDEENADVFMIDQKVYLNIGKKLYIYRDNRLVLWKDMSNANYLGRLWGRNENDLFYVTEDNSLGHYNGKDFVTIYKNFSPPSSAVITENAVFFHRYDKGRNIFLKGKLK